MSLTRWGEFEFATDDSMATITNRPSSDFRAALSGLLSQIAADIIADDPTVAAAAGAAVDGALADTDLMRRSEVGAVRTLDVDDETYTEVRLSHDFRRVGGTLRAGGEVGLGPGAAESALPAGSGVEVLTRDFRRAQSVGGADGLVPQRVLDEWATRLPSSAAFTALTGLGDSMSTDQGGLGTSQTLALAAELGVTGYDRGNSGDTPSQIGWRMGALSWRITVAGGVIPASGAVTATIEPALGHRSTRSWPATLVDVSGQEVSVLLTHGDMTPGVPATFTVEQVGGSSARTVLPGTRIAHVQTHDRAAQSAPATFWVGRNDPDQGRVIAALTAMLAQRRDPAGRVLVLPIFNKADEPSGSPGYVNVMTVNAAIADLAGVLFYDARAALIAHGLTVADITPTVEDTTAIGEDRIPPSLMRTDGLHLNVAGRLALARILAIEIRGRNW